MYYKELATEFFAFMTQVKNKPMPNDVKDYSRGEMGIMLYLTFKQDGVTSGQLSEALSVSTGRIATALKNLEKKNLIVRQSGTKDKRTIHVYVTELGKESTIEKHTKAIGEMEKNLQKLGKEDAMKFVELTKRLLS